MIALDSNVLLRHLYEQDDLTQTRAANRLIGEALASGLPIFVSAVVLVETVWVLRRAYSMTRAGVISVLEALCGHPGFAIEHASAVRSSLAAYRAGQADFADHLLGRIGADAGAGTTYTFDAGLRRIRGFTVLDAR